MKQAKMKQGFVVDSHERIDVNETAAERAPAQSSAVRRLVFCFVFGDKKIVDASVKLRSPPRRRSLKIVTTTILRMKNANTKCYRKAM